MRAMPPQVFNVGQMRRAKYKKLLEETGKKADQSANFFDCSNDDAKAVREALAAECLENLIDWLKEGGNVGIHGASERPSRGAEADAAMLLHRCY